MGAGQRHAARFTVGPVIAAAIASTAAEPLRALKPRDRVRVALGTPRRTVANRSGFGDGKARFTARSRCTRFKPGDRAGCIAAAFTTVAWICRASRSALCTGDPTPWPRGGTVDAINVLRTLSFRVQDRCRQFDEKVRTTMASKKIPQGRSRWAGRSMR